jgi:UDP-N-acetylmuramoyl-tripeptide--D-alanyl-D-alanine ligase
MSIEDIEKSLVSHETPIGRMRILEGVSNSTIIDDTYNSSPIAVAEALNTLAELNTEGKKIAVLGDMRELGEFSEKEHEKAGRQSAKSAEFLIFVGDNVLSFVKGALEAGINRNCIFTFASSAEAGEKLKALLANGDLALVKGSQGVRMEKALIPALARTEDVDRFLVRQETEWKKR